jgi:alanine-synthesizing transaminase
MRRFSSRIPWTLLPTELAEAVERRRGSLLDLTQSNPTMAGLPYPSECILAALARPASLQYEPSPLGLPAAREAVSAYYGGRVDPDHVLLTASTSEAYSYLFKLLCDPGDEVLVPRPSYPLFEFLAHLEGVSVSQYPMRYSDGWHIDLDTLETAVTNKTRAIVYVNPNNPTGSYLKQHEYEFLVTLGIPLIIDEVFRDYPFLTDTSRIDTVASRNGVLTFTLSGLSKVCALPQMKLSWIVCGGPRDERQEAMRRLELIADTFLSVGSPVQHALPELLVVRHDLQQAIRERCAANLTELSRAAVAAPVRLLVVEGGWYATLQVPRIRTEEEWAMHLIEDHGVLVQPGFFFDFETEAHLVLSLLTDPHVFSEGVSRTILACKG